ncbi:MAG: YigZ family protein [Acidobacteriota bacterium]
MTTDDGGARQPIWIRTLEAAGRHEIDKIRGSRFLGLASPVASIEDAEHAIEACRAEFPDATHHCWAWRLGRGHDLWRAGDDGEPSGTAGRPILQEIDGRGLTDCLVVVVRWYGGTKLGAGGLVRAYGGAAGAVLDRAALVERRVTTPLIARFAYGATGAVQGVLAARGLEPSRSDYGADVIFELAVPIEEVEAVRAALLDATAGAAVLTSAS